MWSKETDSFKKFDEIVKGLDDPEAKDTFSCTTLDDDKQNYRFAYRMLQAMREQRSLEIDNAGLILLRDALNSNIDGVTTSKLREIADTVKIVGSKERGR